jgi:hypothetical protein
VTGVSVLTHEHHQPAPAHKRAIGTAPPLPASDR